MQGNQKHTSFPDSNLLRDDTLLMQKRCPFYLFFIFLFLQASYSPLGTGLMAVSMYLSGNPHLGLIPVK